MSVPVKCIPQKYCNERSLLGLKMSFLPQIKTAYFDTQAPKINYGKACISKQCYGHTGQKWLKKTSVSCSCRKPSYKILTTLAIRLSVCKCFYSQHSWCSPWNMSITSFEDAHSSIIGCGLGWLPAGRTARMRFLIRLLRGKHPGHRVILIQTLTQCNYLLYLSVTLTSGQTLGKCVSEAH